MSVIAKLLPQGLETARDVCAHRPRTAPEEQRALVDGIPVAVVERDRGALFEREPPVRPVHVDVLDARPRPTRRVDVLREIEWWPSTRSEQPASADAVVDAHARQPLRGAIHVRERVPGFPGLEHRFLDRVLSLAGIAENRQRQPVQASAIRKHHRLECPLVGGFPGCHHTGRGNHTLPNASGGGFADTAHLYWPAGAGAITGR